MLVCDVSDDASVNALISDLLAQTGRIDVLVNNAGLGLLGGAEESSLDQAKALFRRERLWRSANDECGIAGDAAPKERKDHQYELGAGFDPGSL
jgi:NAD(P)-dependent dehydrogenase (short-subunit alcohol dehydrogenase family)